MRYRVVIMRNDFPHAVLIGDPATLDPQKYCDQQYEKDPAREMDHYGRIHYTWHQTPEVDPE